ncbi:MAG: DUF3099 domain-containing protein [Nocardioides sp.]
MPRENGAIRITTASASAHEDIAARQRRYVFSMALRTVCFVAAILTDGVLRWVLVAAALILPYVAVVMANAAATKSDGFRLTDGLPDHPQLSEGAGSEGSGKSDNI